MKYCGKCTQSKNEVLFSKGQAWCKCCVREHQSSRKEDRKTTIKSITHRIKKKLMQYLDNIKQITKRKLPAIIRNTISLEEKMMLFSI
jgi:hypothetical protein